MGSGVPGGAPWRCMDIDLQRWRRLLDEIEDRRSHGGALVLPGVRRSPLAALKIASLLDRGLRRTESGQSIPASRHSSAASEGFAASFLPCSMVQARIAAARISSSLPLVAEALSPAWRCLCRESLVFFTGGPFSLARARQSSLSSSSSVTGHVVGIGSGAVPSTVSGTARKARR